MSVCPDLSRFFTFLLFLFLLHTLGIAMFRFVAALCRNETVMAVVGSAFFLILILLGGFLLSAGYPLACDLPGSCVNKPLPTQHGHPARYFSGQP